MERPPGVPWFHISVLQRFRGSAVRGFRRSRVARASCPCLEFGPFSVLRFVHSTSGQARRRGSSRTLGCTRSTVADREVRPPPKSPGPLYEKKGVDYQVHPIYWKPERLARDWAAGIESREEVLCRSPVKTPGASEGFTGPKEFQAAIGPESSNSGKSRRFKMKSSPTGRPEAAYELNFELSTLNSELFEL